MNIGNLPTQCHHGRHSHDYNLPWHCPRLRQQGELPCKNPCENVQWVHNTCDYVFPHIVHHQLIYTILQSPGWQPKKVICHAWRFGIK